jgi:4-amino-4-deoxy-L-arabinose transferase-like glycosyltransferase
MMGTVQRSRTLTNILFAIGALALGLVAQGYFARSAASLEPTPTDGLLVYAVVVLWFGIAAARTLPLPDLPLPSRPARKFSNRQLGWFLAFFALAGMAIVVSLRFFGQGRAGSLKWALYLAAILFYLAAAYALAPPSRSRLQRDKASYEWIALLSILLVAAFFRLYRFQELPYGLWYDEADNGLWARQILADPNFRPIYVPSTNLPAHFLYLIAFAFRLLGDSMYAIRSVAVVFGMLTVLAAYFCGREVFGWQRSGRYMGLFLAFLLAVSQWDVNWSRMGMHGVTVPFFELWIVAALLRGLRTGQPRAFAWAGVALGLGLCFYTPMRIFPVIVVGFLIAWLSRWLWRTWRERPRTQWVGHALSAWGMPILLLAVGTLLAVGPVAQFSLRYSELFWDRAERISLFKEAEAQAHPLRAVSGNAVRHLLMFNYRGDPNGRHNLPGKAMLDRLGGVLFVLGVVLSLLRWRDLRSVLLLLWLLMPLSGGILTVSFESPQSLRSIGALPAAYLLTCLPMEWFAAEWQRVFGYPARRHLAVVAGSFLLAIGLAEGVTYFHFRARDFASWAAFNPAETRLAQEINLYRHDYEIRFDPLLTAHLATRYLAPDYAVYHHFDPATVFPLQGTHKQGVLLFIAPDTHIVREHAQWLYPDVRIIEFAHPYSDNVVLSKYLFDRDLIASVQGLDASYTSLQAVECGVHDQVDAEIDFDWADQPVGHACSVTPLEVTWNGGLLAPEYGTYTLYVDVPGQASLSLDGRAVFSGPGPQSRQIVMAQGVHALHLVCQVKTGGAVRLMWNTPWDRALRPVPHDALYRSSWPIHGLVGRFYANADWAGEPEMARIDRQIAYYFHFLPLPRPYTVEWSGRLAAPVDGVYRLGVRAISMASLYVDGERVVEHTSPGQYEEGEVSLTAGMHDLRLRFLDDQDRSQIYLYWGLPGAKGTWLIPPQSLFLPEGGAWQ